MRPRVGPSALLLVLAAVATLLVACGGDADSASLAITGHANHCFNVASEGNDIAPST